MRPEKQFLVDEIEAHLDKSDYFLLTNYNRITVDETELLRTELAKQDAEFHVIKNSILNVAAQKRELPDLKEHLTGQTAIIVGGENPSEVAKVVLKFFKDKDKVDVKAGIMDDRLLTRDEVEQLSKLPSLDVLRAQLMGLLNTPAQQLVRVINGVPQAMINVLDAKRRDGEAA